MKLNRANKSQKETLPLNTIKEYPTDKHKQVIDESHDHDILVSLGIDMLWVKKQISNHMAHHTKYEVALLVAIIMLVVERFMH